MFVLMMSSTTLLFSTPTIVEELASEAVLTKRQPVSSCCRFTRRCLLFSMQKTATLL
jgi:hypothetical protein